MKNYIFCALNLVILYLPLSLSAQFNVHFQDMSWEETKEKAQEENKLIFVDGYTTWCEPCKMMDIQVFNRSHVARFFNRNFINYKMDMERGTGPIMVLNHNVTEYPSFLFLTSDGTLVHKFGGYKHADEMIAHSKPALDPANKIKAWDQRYTDGDRKSDFLYNYTFERMRRMDGSHHEIVQAYLATQEDWNLEHNVDYIFKFMEDIDSDMFIHMAKNRGHFEKILGKEKVSRTIDIMVNNKIFNSTPSPSIEEVQSLYILAYPLQGQKMASEYAMNKYLDAGNMEKYLDIAIQYYPSNPELFTTQIKKDLIQKVYAQNDHSDHLLKAYQWAQEIEKSEPGYENAIQTALFQLKLQDKKPGMKTVKSAMKIAKKSKIKKDINYCKSLLKKFKSL